MNAAGSSSSLADGTNWRTPDAPGAGGPRNRQASRGAGHQVTIAEQAEHSTAAMWPTPQSRDHKGAPGEELTHNARPLNEVVRNWATPTSGDAKASGSRNTEASSAHPGLSLTDQVRGDGGTGRFSHPDPKSASAGPASSPTHPSSPRLSLNPTFVEWLMGWPPGWTDCGSPVMGWSLWLQRQRSALSALSWNYAPSSEPEMRQMEMF